MKRELRNFTAKQTTDFAGKNAKLTVHGEVQTRNSNEKISLAKGITENPTIFVAEVQVDAAGVGDAVMGWATVEQKFDVKEGEFKQATILAEENSLTITVQVIHA
jgi:hypothetical protein